MKISLYISVKSISSGILFSDTISVLIFCLDALSILDSGVLQSPTLIVLLSISFLDVLQDFLYVFGCSHVGCIYIYNIYIFLVDSSFEYYEVTFWVPLYGPSFEVYFVSYKYSYPSFFSCMFAWNFLFFSNGSLSVCVGLLFRGRSLVSSIWAGHVFLSIQLFYVF